MSLHQTQVDGRPLRLWVPSGGRPVAGWPLLTLLDGDWVWPLQPPPAAPIRCAVLLPGHDPGPQGRARRAFDFTPTAPDGRPWPDPRRPGWSSGGAAAFLDRLLGPMLSWASAQATLDRARFTLFGHSYGGLFTLYALRRRPDAFARIVCASPSLWWHDGFMTREMEALRAQPPAGPVQVTVIGGSEERWHPLPADPDHPERRGEGISTRPALDALVACLGRVPRLSVRLEVLQGLNHGAVLPASARRALELAGAPGDAHG